MNNMDTPWIRMKDVPSYYCFGRTKAYELVKEFQAGADKRDYIRDGKVLLIKKQAFEDFIRGRNND